MTKDLRPPSQSTLLESGIPVTARLPAEPKPPLKGRLRTVVSAAIALVILLFLLYEFGLSNLIHSRSQRLLLDEFEATLSLPKGPKIEPGDPVGILNISRIGLEVAIIEGTRPADLEQGVGHFRSTSAPGQVGNVVLAGRRTTFGAPLRSIEEISDGDEITVSTRRGIFVYEVFENRVVKPGDPDVVTMTDDNRLTLVTSHPAYLASGRRSVSAALVGEPLVTQPVAGPVVLERNELGLSGDSSVIGELIVLLEVLAVLMAAGIYAFRRGALRASYILGVPLALLVLFLVFDQLNRLLPATL